MAEFCKQCTQSVFGGDLASDFQNIISPEEEQQGICVMVLCEGCGPTRVDREGNCLEYDCCEAGHGDEHRAWIFDKTGREAPK